MDTYSERENPFQRCLAVAMKLGKREKDFERSLDFSAPSFQNIKCQDARCQEKMKLCDFSDIRHTFKNKSFLLSVFSLRLPRFCLTRWRMVRQFGYSREHLQKLRRFNRMSC